MLNGLLIAGETIQLLLEYGIYALIIIAALVVMGIIKRNIKEEMKPESVKRACQKAKTYAEGLAKESETKVPSAVLAATKLNKLKALVEEAAWLGYQIVESKKDIVIEGVAGSLDKLASSLDKVAEDGYVKGEAYVATLKDTIAGVDGAIAKLDKLLAEK